MVANYLFIFAVALGVLFVTGLLLGLVHRLRTKEPQLVENINALLPQVQCGQCGYPGCKPYARAIATGEAINKCPPGGQETIEKLANLLNKEPELLEEETQERVALIRAAECIGCTLCIQACPVDAIIGAPKRMHTVITDYCTGCDLCLPPCPVDCIDMIPVESDKNRTKHIHKQPRTFIHAA